jgi:hypothetical protein
VLLGVWEIWWDEGTQEGGLVGRRGGCCGLRELLSGSGDSVLGVSSRYGDDFFLFRFLVPRSPFLVAAISLSNGHSSRFFNLFQPHSSLLGTKARS